MQGIYKWPFPPPPLFVSYLWTIRPSFGTSNVQHGPASRGLTSLLTQALVSLSRIKLKTEKKEKSDGEMSPSSSQRQPSAATPRSVASAAITRPSAAVTGSRAAATSRPVATNSAANQTKSSRSAFFFYWRKSLKSLRKFSLLKVIVLFESLLLILVNLRLVARFPRRRRQLLASCRRRVSCWRQRQLARARRRAVGQEGSVSPSTTTPTNSTR